MVLGTLRLMSRSHIYRIWVPRWRRVALGMPDRVRELQLSKSVDLFLNRCPRRKMPMKCLTSPHLEVQARTVKWVTFPNSALKMEEKMLYKLLWANNFGRNVQFLRSVLLIVIAFTLHLCVALILYVIFFPMRYILGASRKFYN